MFDPQKIAAVISQSSWPGKPKTTSVTYNAGKTPGVPSVRSTVKRVGKKLLGFAKKNKKLMAVGAVGSGVGYAASKLQKKNSPPTTGWQH